MRETPSPPSDVDLPLDEYRRDFNTRFWRMGHDGGWKLERRQTFREEDNPSWVAFEAGDWDRATALLEETRTDLRQYQQKMTDLGLRFRRVRVVEEPYSGYLLWELHALLIRHECGDRIRVVSAADISDVERDHQLPEIVTLGSDAVYQVRYDKDGRITGGVRSTNTESVRSWARFIHSLHDRGEDLPAFFAREVAGRRPAPTG